MKKVSFSKIIALLLFCLIQTVAFAQGKEITGTVSDVDGAPLPGVSIQVQGTTQGTITDFDGKYVIVAQTDAVLVFSFVGFLSQEVTINGETVIDITLMEDIMELEEIVVTGYGYSKKSDLTGSMASLKEEDFNSGNVSSPEELMQGRISGVQITSNSGEPGAGMMVQIRGANSIRSNTMPLYVIDGVPLDIQNSTPDGATSSGLNSSASATNPLSFLNVNDIESIDVLKDASAAAIYGARGANGVVIITTKKGQEGKSNISYSGSFGISNLPKKIEVLSAEEFIRFREDSLGRTEDHYGSSTDWQDEIFRTAYSQNHSLSMSGGNASTQYRASFGYANQQGIIDKSDMTKFNGRLNLTQKAINDRLTIEANLTAAEQEFNRPPVGGRTGFEGDLLINAIMANPTMPIYTDTGYFQPLVTKRNPRAMLDLIEDNTIEQRVLANLSGTLEIVDGLFFKVNVGKDQTNAIRKVNQSQELLYLADQGGAGDINSRQLSSWVIENTLMYNNTFGGIHSLSFLAGYSYQSFLISGYNIHTEGYTSDEIKYTYNLDGSDPTLSNPSSYGERNELQSFFGRVNYNLAEKYLLTATFRRDGSTKFGANNKYGNFPSVAFAWRASQEEFIQNLNIFNNLKVRVGWGLTGNQEIGSKHSLFSIGTSSSSKGILDGSSVIPGYVLLKTPNENIKWESTEQLNIGLDFGFLKGRLSGSFDWFHKQTTNMLLEAAAKLPAPTPRQVGNVSGSIINRGIELSLTGYVIDRADFSWTIGANFSKINNTVQDLEQEMIFTGVASGPGMTGVDVQVITNGESINSFYGRRFLGFDDNGRGVYQDLDTLTSGDDLLILGSPLPDYTFSISNTFQYKNFDFGFFIQGVQGNLIYNNTANSIGTIPNIYTGNNTFPEVITTGENRLNPSRFSDRFLEDGSYIRLSNASLGYTFNTNNITWLSKCRIYLAGNNLFVLTDYSGYDPDVNTDANVDGIASLGIDNTNYPKARSYTFGVNITF